MSFSGDLEPKSMLCPMKIGAQSFSYAWIRFTTHCRRKGLTEYACNTLLLNDSSRCAMLSWKGKFCIMLVVNLTLFSWKSGKVEGQKKEKGQKKWNDRKDFSFPNLCFSGRGKVEKREKKKIV